MFRRRFVVSISVVPFVFVAVIAMARQVPAPTPQRNVPRLYGELCANCHGPELQGAQAQSLVDDEWKFGGDDESLARSIRDGHPEAGMPPMGGALTEEEIRGLVIFIREAAAKRQREGAAFAKPLPDTPVKSERHTFLLETVAEGLETPWSVAFLPGGRMLVTEKPGRLRIVQDGKVSEPVSGLPPVWDKGQGGLLDVAVHPQHAANGWIYLSFSDPGEGDSAMTAVIRGKLRDGALVEQQVLFRVPQALYRMGPPVHFGSRFVFDGKGYLFFSIGERGHAFDAQDLARPNGKIHRIHDDGRVPDDNPFAKKEGALPTIWTYGNRNAQGLAQHPVTGDLWEAEHGPRGGDELNLLQPGLNYGWPVITFGMNYDGTPMTTLTSKEGMEQPVIHWTPSIAVCAIDFYTGDRFPGWKNHLFVGALAQQELRRVEIHDRRVVHQEVLFKNAGRIRDVVNGPDGFLYVVFNDPGRVARLVPAAEGGSR
jgi:glucose/arabinose dehydrogenase